VNISDLESIAPTLVGNVSSGWVSVASGSNPAYNSSLQYYVMKTNNPSEIEQELSSNITAGGTVTPSIITPGTYNGLSYSYYLYENSTGSIQMVSGWKNNNVVLEILESSPAYVAKETLFISTAANDTT
jgi:hypothetical protein